MRVAPIASTQTIMDRGERVTSVGCDRGRESDGARHAGDQRRTATKVRQTSRPAALRSKAAAAAGCSIRPAQLVGVCFAADYEGNEGLYTALESIHDELDRLDLSDVYRKPEERAEAGSMAAAAPTTTATPPIVRGQEPMQPVMPLSDSECRDARCRAWPSTPTATAAGATPPDLNQR